MKIPSVSQTPQVSRTHARLTFQDDHWVIYDQQSRNGTFVNGRRIQYRALEHGDRIRIGAITLRFLELENQEEFHSLMETQVSAPTAGLLVLAKLLGQAAESLHIARFRQHLF